MTFDDDKTSHHPAYGNLQISRCQGHVALYDSPLRHNHFVALRIDTASFDRNLNQRWHRGERRVVEVYLSAAQWAEAITSMGTSGVPCTLHHYRDPETGEVMRPRLAEPDSQRGTFEEEIEEACAGLVTKVNAAQKQLDEALSGKTVRKGDLVDLKETLAKLSMVVSSSLPFIQTQFFRATEKVTQQAKAEVVAVADQVVHSHGLAALGVKTGEQLLGGAANVRRLGVGQVRPDEFTDEEVDAIENEVERRTRAALEEEGYDPDSDSVRAMYLRQDLRVEVSQDFAERKKERDDG